MDSAKKTSNNSPSVKLLKNSKNRPPTHKSNEINGEEEDDSVWICPICSVAYVDGAADMVGCDACDRWFHW